MIKESPCIGNRNQRSGPDIIVIIHYSTRDFNHRVTFTEHFIVYCYRLLSWYIQIPLWSTLLLLLLLFDQSTRSVKYCLNNNIKNNQYINSFFVFGFYPVFSNVVPDLRRLHPECVFSVLYTYNIANIPILCC